MTSVLQVFVLFVVQHTRIKWWLVRRPMLNYTILMRKLLNFNQLCWSTNASKTRWGLALDAWIWGPLLYKLISQHILDFILLN